jgi:hypothetical protein
MHKAKSPTSDEEIVGFRISRKPHTRARRFVMLQKLDERDAAAFSVTKQADLAATPDPSGSVCGPTRDADEVSDNER